MKLPKHPTLIRRQQLLRLRRLATIHPLVMASLVQIARPCGQPRCRCVIKGQLHKSWYLTHKNNGVTRTQYVPREELEEVRAWVSETRRVRGLLREVSQMGLALLDARARIRREQRKHRRKS